MRLETLDDVSMAFLVLLQRLSPVERAVFLLHEVFGFCHSEVSELVGKGDAACRQILHRARDHVRDAKRALVTTREEHRRLLEAFLRAAAKGDAAELARLLADDVVLVADGGEAGVTLGRARSLRRPL